MIAASGPRRWMLAGVGLAILIAALAAWWFWRPRVALSGDGYDVAIALYGACNRRSNEQVGLVRGKLDETVKDQRIAPQAEDALRRVIALAEADRWNEAAMACRTLLEQQVTPP